MRNITGYILESHKDELDREILDREDVTFDVLDKALYGSSFMDDRACIYLSDSGCWIKIDKDKWHFSPNQSHALGGTISTKEFWTKYVEPAKELKMYQR